MSRPTVIVTRALPAPWLAALAAECELVIGPAAPPPASAVAGTRFAGRGAWCDATWSALPRADAILSLLTEPVDAAVLDAAPRLRVVSNMAVGVDNIDLAACAARGIPVGHTPGVLTDATADLTMALVLAHGRRVLEAADDARAGRWSTWSPDGWLGRDLCDATLGIVGWGQIGRAVARRAAGFGLHCLVHSRTPPAPAAGIEPVGLAALLSRSDIVSLHVPLSPQTRHLVDARALAAMQPHALLVNTSRGAVVDQDALVDALRRGVIAGAALDVTDPEPLPPTHPLFSLPQVLVLPHIGSATLGTRRTMAELAARNVLAALRGEPLPHAITRG
ncbi:MAG: D-glycerate dehydrogenase [Nannocystaceae bacterium]|nr:D-glycerate dehydrogenase [Nannocystaceae bacterium]